MVKNTLSVAPARTASLTDLRWPGDGFLGKKSEVGNPTLLRDRSRKSDLGLYRSRISDLGAGLAGWRLLCRAGGAAGLLCRAGMWRARYRSRWASHQTRLGEPVLIGRARTHWASIKQGWASHQTRLGEPVLIGRTTQPLSQWPTPAPAWRCACSAQLQVPARHVYLSACSALCLLGTFT